MPSEDGTKSAELDDTSNTTATTEVPLRAATPEPPYSIFDKRQKWLIIIVASTAATCESVFALKLKLFINILKQFRDPLPTYIFPLCQPLQMI